MRRHGRKGDWVGQLHGMLHSFGTPQPTTGKEPDPCVYDLLLTHPLLTPPPPLCRSVFPCHTPEQVRSELPPNTDVVAFQVRKVCGCHRRLKEPALRQGGHSVGLVAGFSCPLLPVLPIRLFPMPC